MRFAIRWTKTFAVASLVWLVTGATARADLMLLEFAGVTSLDTAGIGVAPGTAFSGSWTIDTSIADTVSDPTVGAFPGAIVAFDLEVGGTHTLTSGDGDVTILDDYSPVGDHFEQDSDGAFGGSLGPDVSAANSYFTSSSYAVLPSDQLASVPVSLDIDDWDHGELIIYFSPLGGGGLLAGDVLVADLRLIPAPGAVFLALIGFPLFGLMRRRKTD